MKPSRTTLPDANDPHPWTCGSCHRSWYRVASKATPAWQTATQVAQPGRTTEVSSGGFAFLCGRCVPK